MVQAREGGRRGFWQAVREQISATPLAGRLITVVLTLVAVALLVISVAGIGFLRGFLLGQANTQLYAYANSPHNQSAVQAAIAGGGQVTTPSGLVIDWLPAKGKLERLSMQSTGIFGNPNGQVQAPGPSVSANDGWLITERPATVGAISGSGRWQVISVQLDGPNGHVIWAVDVTNVYQTTSKLAAVDWIVSGLLLLVLAIVGVAVIRASLRPLTDIEQTAGAIAAGDLSRRVPERDPRTEVGRLGRSLNAMLTQIERSFNAQARSEEAARRSEGRMRQFVADASHELRTPLTAIRGFAEYYRQRGGIDITGSGPGQLAPADLERIMRRVEQEAARMGVLVEDMLLLARLDQQRPLEARPVDLLTLAADAVHDARVVAPDRSINLTVGSGAALLVIGDEVRLRQVIGNLMSNALTHTPDGTAIDVLIRSGNLDEAPAAAPPPPPAWPDDSGADAAVAAENDTAEDELAAESWNAPMPVNREPQPAAVLEVADHGHGLTKEQADHVFERFYRADQARTSGGGTGLGLAIVAALVAAHGGATWVRSRPGEGATFCIALPLSDDAVQGSEDDYDADADETDADEIGLGLEDHAHGNVS
jgi:two-component system OmpR family sensor kinase